MASPDRPEIDTEWAESGPFQIFGPCSAESMTQLRSTAEGIALHSERPLFRAGVWKPRTRPNSFEGVGAIGLEWLCRIKEEFGFMVCTEVANAEHVAACLDHGIDMLWIGARTTVSPFAVQEIADALVGTDVPVFVKNPIHADLSLWVGAIERMRMAGIKKLGAIHRGFHQVDSAPYRNSPLWNIPIELKRMFPDLPIVCDVSHISGTPDLIPFVAQRSLDLDMNGLMIETHIDPSSALSDAAQQVTPTQLATILSNLVHRASHSGDKEFELGLEKLRSEIDGVNSEILELMAHRMGLARQIGVVKQQNDVTILQVDRWQSMLDNCIAEGCALGLSEAFISGLLKDIHAESIRHQNEVMNPNGLDTDGR